MALRKTERSLEEAPLLAEVGSPAWKQAKVAATGAADPAIRHRSDRPGSLPRQSSIGSLQTLLSFAALYEQSNNGTIQARHLDNNRGLLPVYLADEQEFALDEALQLVAERALAITGADGSAIALAENDEIVMRVAAGNVRPKVGARIDCDSAFSRMCLRRAQVVNCDDSETDEHVNLQACRSMGSRSMVAVPLFGRQRVIGLLEVFSVLPFAFNDSDIANLESLAGLVHGILKPEDEDRFSESAQIAVNKLEPIAHSITAPIAIASGQLGRQNAVSRKEVQVLMPDGINTTCRAAAEVPDQPRSDEAAAPKQCVEEQGPRPQPLSQPAKSMNYRGDIVLLFASIAVVVALAEGVWWKPRTAGLSGEIVEKARTQAVAPMQTPPSSTSLNLGATPRLASSGVGRLPNSPTLRKDLSTLPRVSAVEHRSSEDSSTVVFELDNPVQYEAHRIAKPERIYFDLHDTELVPALDGKSIKVGDALLNRIRIAKLAARTTRIVLETKAPSDFSVRIEPDPYRLIVEVRKMESLSKGR